MADERLPRALLSETSRGGDLLQHRPLARAIANAIRETPKEESLGIALYGAWGQGKSMIGKLLNACLTEAPEDRWRPSVRVKSSGRSSAWTRS